jgi:LAO/AO transport system kinase
MIRAWRRRDLTVGVLCIDPSSKKSGGALLGDRLRMQLDGVDDGVFVRSMAARERLGGLAPMTLEAVLAMRHHCDRVLIETVGVGQSETDIAHIADVTLVIIQPGSGDMLQFVKAGLMEVFDALVVNKSDLGPLAEHTRRELMAALRAQGRRAPHSGDAAAVFMTSARDDLGIDSMIEYLENQDIAPGHLHAALVERALAEYATWFGMRQVRAEGGLPAIRARLALASTPLALAALFRP